MNPSYIFGDYITYEGSAIGDQRNVDITIISPTGQNMAADFTSIRADGTFNGQIPTDETWFDSGTYTIMAISGPETYQATFQFEGMSGDISFGFGGILDTESIVGIEELSTLNVGGPKTATVNNGPRAEGTFLTVVMSANVCGDSLCDRPMTVKEKIEMYLLEKFETIVLEKAMKIVGFGVILDEPGFDRNFIPTHATESLPDRESTEMDSIKKAITQGIAIPEPNRSIDVTISEVEEKIKDLSSAFVLEMYRADATSDLGDLQGTVNHLKEMKSIFKEIKKLEIQKAELQAEAGLAIVQKFLDK